MALSLRASATSRPPLPPPRTSSVAGVTPKISSINVKVNSLSVNVVLPTSTSLSLLSLITPPVHDAKALTLPKDQIVSSLNQVESTIDQIQQVGSNTFNVISHLFGNVVEAVKPGIDAALPYAKQVGEEAVKVASPALSEASKKAQEAIQSTGFDTQPVVSAAKTVADVAQQTTKVIGDAKPIATSTMETISSASPIVVLEAGGALFLAYLLLPPVLSAISFNLRGYKGDLSPAQTLELMSSKNYVLIDIRSEKDKNKAGIPRLPSSAKNQIISIPLEELPNKVRSIVKNAKKVEAELVALKISYLKKIGKGSNIVIMDTYTDSAKIVAKLLTSLGFKNSWIVKDGFSGSKGWLQSNLGTDSYKVSFSQVLSPSKIIPAASTTRFVAAFGPDPVPFFRQFFLPSPDIGPDSIGFAKNDPGAAYVSISDGRVLKFTVSTATFVDFAFTAPGRNKTACDGNVNGALSPTCGKVFALFVDKFYQVIYLADANLGLFFVPLATGGQATLITNCRRESFIKYLFYIYLFYLLYLG